MNLLFSLLFLLPLTPLANLSSLAGSQPVEADGDMIESSPLEGKVTGIYFSAAA